VLSRGGGTSLAGQCCNVAVVIDWSKYMNQVLEINLHDRWARVLPGTVCDALRVKAQQESEQRLTWGPDPATHDRCCFGGMIGNNSCGAHAQMSGKTDNNIEELEVLLYDGTVMKAGWMSDLEMDARIHDGGHQGEIYRHLRSLRDHYAPLIKEKYPPIPRRVSGYNLDQLLPDTEGRFNLGRALVGSESTLVTVLEAKVRLVDARAQRVILMLGYPDIYEAADHVMEIVAYRPTALEGIDERLIENVQRKGGPHRRYLSLLPEGKGWLMVELGGDEKDEALEVAHRLMEDLQKLPNAPSMKLYTEHQDMNHIWEIRESGLGATALQSANAGRAPVSRIALAASLANPRAAAGGTIESTRADARIAAASGPRSSMPAFLASSPDAALRPRPAVTTR
jgi:FAD/FMN-containing dehydrogenase